MLSGLCIRVHLQQVLDNISADSHEVGGRLCEDISVLVKEIQ
jgi:hypothetical protein